EPPTRPHGGPAPDSRSIVEEALGAARKRGVTAVADGNQDIADETVAPGPLDGGFREQLAKSRVIEPCQIGKRRCVKLGACRKLGVPPLAGKIFPRANREAIVAAIEPGAHHPAEKTGEQGRGAGV